MSKLFLTITRYLLYFELEGQWDEVSDLKWVYLKEMSLGKWLDFGLVFEMENRKVLSWDSASDLCTWKSYLRRLLMMKNKSINLKTDCQLVATKGMMLEYSLVYWMDCGLAMRSEQLLGFQLVKEMDFELELFYCSH